MTTKSINNSNTLTLGNLKLKHVASIKHKCNLLITYLLHHQMTSGRHVYVNITYCVLPWYWSSMTQSGLIRARSNITRYCAECENTVQCRYNVVNFLHNPHKIHPIAHPQGRDMVCLLWINTPGLILWYIFCPSRWSDVCNIMLYWTAL